MDGSQLPIDLVELALHVLHNPLSLQFVHSVTNAFFVAQHNKVAVREGDPASCWDILPPDWRACFDRQTTAEARREALRDLANGTILDEYPTSLVEFVSTCTRLCLDRTCSFRPLLASGPPSLPSATPPSIPNPTKLSSKYRNAEAAGLSEKKRHEVVQFSALVSSILHDPSPPTHAIDIGSGRAHLSRALSTPPLALNVLALDGSEHQITAAKKLDTIKACLPFAVGGSLSHQTNRLDAEGIKEVLTSWPPPPSEGEREGEKAMVVALHACGNLTVDTLRAFCEVEKGSQETGRKGVMVGCCYNLMTPSNFPLSNLVASLPTNPSSLLTQEHLRLTPQAPQTWHHSPHSTAALSKSIHKLAFRARFEAELEAHHHGSERSIGRLPSCASYAEYRQLAMGKFRSNSAPSSVEEEEWDLLPFPDDEWEEAIYRLQVFWTLRSLLGPCIESLLLLDRWAFVVEQLGPERQVQLVNLFEQATGSLRNVAIVVR